MAQSFNCIVELIKHHLTLRADELVYSYINESGATTLTFAQLDQVATTLAAQLLEVAKPGERVVLMLPQGMDYICHFYACLYAGIIVVPFYPPTSKRHADKVLRVINDAKASVVLCETTIREDITACLDPDSDVKLCHLSIGSSIDNSTDSSSSRKTSTKLPLPGSQDIAFLQYSSGSTGNPKGVMISHQNVLENLTAIKHVLKMDHSDVLCNWVPLFHDLGLVSGCLLPVYLGAHCILMPPARLVRRPMAWLKLISDYRVTFSGGPNFAYDLCLKRIKPAQLEELDLSSWRIAVNAAEPIDPDIVSRFSERFSACGFANNATWPCYGMAEVTLFLTGNPVDEPPTISSFSQSKLQHYIAQPAIDPDDSQQLVGVGQVESGYEVRIVSQNTGLELPKGRVGEIWCAGPSIAQGYWGDEEKTREAFAAKLATSPEQTYLRTGDLGFIHQDQLYISGRIKDILIIKGRNYYPQDIELCAGNSYPGLRQPGTAAFQIGQQLVVIQEIEAKALRTIDYQQVSTAIAANIFAEFELVVGTLLCVKAGGLPKTSSGKLQRSQAKSSFLQHTFDSLFERDWKQQDQQNTTDGVLLPETKTEQLLSEIWQQLLHIKQPTTADDFFSLGGDSMTAIRLVADISRLCAVQLTIRDLFEHPTLGQLAIAIDSNASNIPLAQIVKSSDQQPLLSFGQQQLWLIDQMFQGDALYHLPVTLQIDGQLNVTALEQAFNALIARHQVLHSVYPQSHHADEPMTVQPLPQWQFKLTYDDMLDSPVTYTPDSKAVQQKLNEHSWRQFNLTTQLPIRALVIKLAPSQFMVNFTIHHIATDGWSTGVINHQLSELYRQLSTPESLQLSSQLSSQPQLPIQYSDYAIWQRQWITTDSATQQRNYWISQLKDLPKLHGLALDHARPQVPSYQGAMVVQQLDSDLTAALQQLATQQRVTLFMLLHASLACLMQRYSGENDIAIGTTVAERQSVETFELVGFFVNTLVLRSDFSAIHGFSDILQQTKVTVLNALAHQQYPFDELVNDLAPQRSLSYNPLFQVMMTLHNHQYNNHQHNTQHSELKLAGLQSTLQVQHDQPALFDFELDIYENTDNLRIEFKYATDLFNQSTIANLAECFVELLRGICQDPSVALDDLNLVSAKQQQQLISFNGPRVNYPGLPCIHQRFEQQALLNPHAIAIAHGNQTVTYHSLNQAANRLAHYLKAQGIGANSLVGIYAHRSAVFLTAILAIMKAGGAYVPLDPMNPPQRIKAMIADAQLTLLLSEVELVAQLGPIEAIQPFYLDHMDTQLNSMSVNNPANINTADDYAYMIYTSGSTGQPKGALVHHGGALNHIDAEFDVLGFTTPDKQLLPFNLLQSAACSSDVSVWQFLAPVVSGGKTVIVDNMTDMTMMVRAMQQHQVQLIETAPVVLQYLMDYLLSLSQTERDLPDLAWLMSIAEAVPVGMVNQWLSLYPDIPIMNGYGPSEASDDISQYIIRHSLPDSVTNVPIGSPLANLTLYVLSPGLQLQPVGAPGEIGVSGIGVGPGYWNNPQRSQQSFVANPFDPQTYGFYGQVIYKTGDLGRWSADGQLEFMGRIDDQVKIRGFRVELGEIEAVLGALDEVSDVAVVVHRDQHQEKVLCAYLVSHQGLNTDTAQLTAQLEEKLPQHMIPAHFIWLAQMPLNAADKIDRKALPKPDFSAVRADHIAPQSDTEHALVQLWSKLLKVDAALIGSNANFFALGGHSLLGVALISAISDQLAVQISIKDIFFQPTLADLAQQIDARLTIAKLAQQQRNVTIKSEGTL
jgi:amino acid adenylation domain-containing protein